jgi:hypothetical protein
MNHARGEPLATLSNFCDLTNSDVRWRALSSRCPFNSVRAAFTDVVRETSSALSHRTLS